MSKRSNFISALKAALFVCLAAILPAQQLAVPQHVPENVKSVISIGDAGKAWQGLGQSPLRRKVEALLALPAVNSSPQYQDFTLMLDKAELELGFSLRPDAFLGPVLKGADFYIIQGPADPAPQIVITAKFAEETQAAAFAGYVASQIEQKSTTAKPLQIQENSIAGMAVKSVPAINIHFGAKSDLFLLGTTQAALQSALESPGPERLKENQELASALEKLKTTGELFYHVNGEQIKTYASMIPDPRVQNQSLGFNTATGIASFAPDRINLVYLSREDASSPQVTAANAKINQLLAFAGPSPLLGIAINYFDAVQFQEMSDSTLGTSMPAVGQALDQMKRLEAELGISFQDDVIPAFGPDAAFFVNELNIASLGNMSADVLITLGVKDEAKARKTMSALEKLMHRYATEQMRLYGINAQTVQPVEETYKSTVIRTVPYKHPLLNAPMGMSYAFTEKHVVLTLTADAMKAALDRATADKGALGKSSSFAEASRGFPSDYHQFLTVDFARLVAMVQAFLPMIASIGQVGPEEIGLITGIADITKSLGTLYSVSQIEETGSVNYVTFMLQP